MAHKIATTSFALDLIKRNSKLLCDSRNLICCAGKSNHSWVPYRNIGLEHLWRIPLRVNGDKYRLHLDRTRRRLFLEQPQALRNPLKIKRANVRAKAIAEIDEPILALEICQTARLSVLIRKRERSADSCTMQVRLTCRSGSIIRAVLRWRATGKGKYRQKTGKGVRFVHHWASLAMIGHDWQLPIIADTGHNRRMNALPPSRTLKRSLIALLLSLLLWPSLATAQFSDGYNFLKAIRDKDGAKVMEFLGKPGSTIINTRDVSTSQTALHIVTARRDTAWIEFLIAKGANPNLTDGNGDTPLMIATQLRFTEGAQTLLDKGAQVDKPNGSGETPLIRAVHLNDLPMIRLLISKGANPLKKDLMAGLSARDYAVRDGRSQTIIDLLDSAKPKSTVSGPVQGPSL